jgi:ankyrin repeat protein
MLDDTEAIIQRIQKIPNFNINEKVNVRGDTLLHYAAKRNNHPLIRYLMNYPGIDPSIKNDLGKTPKDLALP